MSKINKINAGQIVTLLRNKHIMDIFVGECKDGPTGHGLAQIDAWVMKKSWAHPLMIGYEIKVSRQDFLRDRKWSNYLGMCNELIFVCPWDIIHINEVPTDCGLMWVSKSGTRITTKKKAPYRGIKEPVGLLKYLLMARTKITSRYKELNGNNGLDRRFWEEWLTSKKDNWCFGHNLGKSLREEIEAKIVKVNSENTRLLNLIKDYEKIAAIIKDLGFDPKIFSIYQVSNKIRDLKQGIPKDLVYAIENLKNWLTKTEEGLKKCGIEFHDQ